MPTSTEVTLQPFQVTLGHFKSLCANVVTIDLKLPYIIPSHPTSYQVTLHHPKTPCVIPFYPTSSQVTLQYPRSPYIIPSYPTSFHSPCFIPTTLCHPNSPYVIKSHPTSSQVTLHHPKSLYIIQTFPISSQFSQFLSSKNLKFDLLVLLRRTSFVARTVAKVFPIWYTLF